MSIASVAEATEYAAALVVSVVAFGFLLFGGATVLERWLDDPVASDDIREQAS